MKEFTCTKEGCESKQFVIVTTRQTLVDFSREGAVEGHPFLEYLSTSAGGVFCYECETRVPDEMAREIVRESV